MSNPNLTAPPQLLIIRREMTALQNTLIQTNDQEEEDTDVLELSNKLPSRHFMTTEVI